MKIGTIAVQKYFNGVAGKEESQEYQEKIAEYFSHVGMFAFGQMAYIAKKGPNPEKDYDWKTIDSFVKFCTANQ